MGKFRSKNHRKVSAARRRARRRRLQDVAPLRIGRSRDDINVLIVEFVEININISIQPPPKPCIKRIRSDRSALKDDFEKEAQRLEDAYPEFFRGRAASALMELELLLCEIEQMEREIRATAKVNEEKTGVPLCDEGTLNEYNLSLLGFGDSITCAECPNTTTPHTEAKGQGKEDAHTHHQPSTTTHAPDDNLPFERTSSPRYYALFEELDSESSEEKFERVESSTSDSNSLRAESPYRLSLLFGSDSHGATLQKANTLFEQLSLVAVNVPIDPALTQTAPSSPTPHKQTARPSANNFVQEKCTHSQAKQSPYTHKQGLPFEASNSILHMSFLEKNLPGPGPAQKEDAPLAQDSSSWMDASGSTGRFGCLDSRGTSSTDSIAWALAGPTNYLNPHISPLATAFMNLKRQMPPQWPVPANTPTLEHKAPPKRDPIPNDPIPTDQHSAPPVVGKGLPTRYADPHHQTPEVPAPTARETDTRLSNEENWNLTQGYSNDGQSDGQSSTDAPAPWSFFSQGSQDGSTDFLNFQQLFLIGRKCLNNENAGAHTQPRPCPCPPQFQKWDSLGSFKHFYEPPPSPRTQPDDVSTPTPGTCTHTHTHTPPVHPQGAGAFQLAIADKAQETAKATKTEKAQETAKATKTEKAQETAKATKTEKAEVCEDDSAPKWKPQELPRVIQTEGDKIKRGPEASTPRAIPLPDTPRSKLQPKPKHPLPNSDIRQYFLPKK